jgi:phenylpyruvate tautomerase PptA (4-oxalocrotonate tautomerase family)
MPLVKISSSVELPADKRTLFLAAVSLAVSEVTGKPERYMMVTCDTGSFLLDGTGGPAAYVDIRAIGGLTPPINAKLSARLCDLLLTWMTIPGDRVYLTFTDLPATHWGHRGATFG